MPYIAQTDRQKKRSAKRKDPFYSSKEWQRLRYKTLRANPDCDCGQPADTVDHIKSRRTHPFLQLDPLNLRTMCRSCHSARTIKDEGLHSAAPASCDKAGMPTDPEHPWFRK